MGGFLGVSFQITFKSLTNKVGTFSRVPLSPLNPEGEILMFCVSYGATANFAMVPNFEESAKKSTRELVKWVVLVSSTQNSG